MFLVLGIIAGFGAGCWLPAQTNYIVTIGMIAAAIIPFSSVFGVMFLSGYLVASYLQNSFITEFTATKNNINRMQAVLNVKYFMCTFGLSVLAFALVGSTSSLSYALMVYSAYLIFSQIFSDLPFVVDSGKSFLICVAGFAALFTAAILTILNIDKIAIFAFFLAIRTFPSIIGKSKNVAKHPTKAAHAFAYAIGGDGPFYHGILLAQTIMWGSQKDAIGTVINAALGSVIDPFRFIWAVIMFFCILAFYCNIERLQPRIDKIESTTTKSDPIAQPFMFGLSLFFAIVILGWVHTIVILTLGLIVALCLPTEIINKFSVPSLLVCGVAL